jgi:hypothetical protein
MSAITLIEWIELQHLIVSYWPYAKALTDEQLQTQYELVCRLDRDTVARAIREHAVSGAEFPPGPGQLVARIQAEPVTSQQIIEAQALAERRKAERLGLAGLPRLDA